MECNDETPAEDISSSSLHDNQEIIDDQAEVDEMLREVVSMRSEESITEAASKKIEQVLGVHRAPLQVNSNEESKRELDRRVRIGEITPFQASEQAAAATTSGKPTNIFSGLCGLEDYLKKQAQLLEQRKKFNSSKAIEQALKIQNKSVDSLGKSTIEKTKRCRNKRIKVVSPVEESQELNTSPATKTEVPAVASCIHSSGSEYVPSDGEIIESDDEFEERGGRGGGGKGGRKRKRIDESRQNSGKTKISDDGDEMLYRERMQTITRNSNNRDSLYTIENLFKIPKSIWKRLYEYQRVSVRWLWELHRRDLGGLLGDEMGLGKTIQVIAFLAALDASELLSDGERFRGLGASLIVCPATLLEQWVMHFHDWAPTLRVVVLHHSGTYNVEPEYLIESIMKTGGILLTSYSGVLGHKDLLVSTQWHYVILDEGHKIRNPEAKVSKLVKRFSTPHRLLLTGSPMQNSLKELWSLFDFILPGKLGTLPTFIEHCANPITRGGYANATPLQEATALQVATMLKDAITPYMLRRTKQNVQHHINLPQKNEQVLFCSLTEHQKNLYKEYLRTDHVSSVLHDKSSCSENSYRARLLVALTNLRKICNHPDLYTYAETSENISSISLTDDDRSTLVIPNENDEESLENFGYWKRSGKLTVVRSLLKIWKSQAHRVLLFTQGRQMMHILEALVQKSSYTYLRLDGSTPMSQRQQTIRKFNNDSSYFVFISTTRVGGLGVNLTGADRVVIYDPDWNPAIDAQARERAWRIGQDKRVTIYRLITAGTVEEKIYHRQIFKLLLSNRVLDDPRQRRLFQTSDLAELFNYNEPLDGTTSESDRIFNDCKLKPLTVPTFSAEKIREMRELASSVSKRIHEISKIGEKVSSSPSVSGSDGQSEKRRRKKRKHRSNKRTDHETETDENCATFEGEKVPGLVGRRLERPTSSDQDDSSTCDDQYVLTKLFAKTKVTSAFKHEAVLSKGTAIEGTKVNPMDQMARDTAQQSMDTLRQSRKWCWKPTWDLPPKSP